MAKCTLLIAPNAFKGSVTATEAADQLADGIKRGFSESEVKKLPIGDGGDGTGKLITNYLNGDVIYAAVHDPLGRIIDASYGLVDDGKTAVIEMAAASGISLLYPDELNPLSANSYGTGELILDTLDKGVKKILLTIGGSATVDGGTGILRALGIVFLDKTGRKIDDLPHRLSEIAVIDNEKIDPRLVDCQIIVLCDVTNPLLGEHGAAAVFAPQKGADAATIQVLEEGLHHFANLIHNISGKNVESMTYGGAAGGVAAGLSGLINAELVNGLKYFLSLINFEEELKKCDIVITGEGAIDEQTLRGKGPMGVARLAKKYDKMVIGVGGSILADMHSELWDHFDVLLPVNFHLQSVEDAMASAADNLKLCGFNLGRMLYKLWTKK